MMVDKENWSRFFSGYVVADCTIGFEEGRLGFLLFEDLDEDSSLEDGWQIRVVAVKLGNSMETRFFSLSANGLGTGAQLSSAWSPAQPEFVSAATSRAVYSYRPKEYKGSEGDIPFDAAGKLKPDAYSEFDCAILKTVRVGETVFALGSAFRIFERVPGRRWQEHRDIPIPVALGSADRETALHAIGNTEFRDLAGTAVNDMYAVGSEGAVWQRTKGQWRAISFPTNLDLFTVAVAPDGIAYITDRRGGVWRGQDARWERIVTADNALPYRDSAWFAGRLWCTNDSAGPFVLEGGKMVPGHRAKQAPMPAQIATFAHCIDVSPDGATMLVAGRYGAATFDGTTWAVLFDGDDFSS